MVKVTVDGKEIIVEEGANVIQACEEAGVMVPRFCYHSRLAIAGNCRMCLVEIDKFPKPVASCAQPVSENMIIHTNTPLVKKAREGVMEFMLANHPLDCPICDQAGECDLQDQSMAFGKATSRYNEEKRAVEEKNFGPLVKTEMTRCIHCTRCVRFITDVAGVPEIGALFRGEDMQIQTYIEKSITSELSGNIIDLCPVGALTSKPYAFKARSWELNKTESIDVLDAVGSNIRIDSKGNDVLRILPKLNEDINEEWISDKTRFACDGLLNQRLDCAFIRINGKLVKASLQDAFKEIAKEIKKINTKTEMAAIAGGLTDVESMFALKKLFNALNCNQIDCRQFNENISNSSRADYIFNTTIPGIENADLCLIIGSNPRKEAPILNARIKKANLLLNLKIAVIGEKLDLTYDYNYLGDELNLLNEIYEGKHDFSTILKNSKNPIVILGNDLLSDNEGKKIHALCKLIAEKYNCIRNDWNGFNYIPKYASFVGGMDIGFLPEEKGLNVSEVLQDSNTGKIKLLYLLGFDEIDPESLKNTFVIYQGHHGDKGAHAANVILPSAAYTEKDATYVNLEGRVQRVYRAVRAPGDALEDWNLISELSNVLGIDLGFSNLENLREEIFYSFPHLKDIDMIAKSKWKKETKEVKIKAKKFKNIEYNFYLTDPISRASVTMNKCAELIEKSKV